MPRKIIYTISFYSYIRLIYVVAQNVAHLIDKLKRMECKVD